MYYDVFCSLRMEQPNRVGIYILSYWMYDMKMAITTLKPLTCVR